MKNPGKFLLSACGLATAALLSACGGGDGLRTVNIEFAAVAGATPVVCGTTVAGLGTGNVNARVKDLRFYISGVHLITDKDDEVPVTLTANEWQLTSGSDTVTLIDLENGTGDCSGGTAATNIKITGTVPAGTYTGIGMTLGVPDAINHSDFATAAKPLDIAAMAWSWQAGRKFAKIELSPETTLGSGVFTDGIDVYVGEGVDHTASTFNVHLGSTGCTPSDAAPGGYTCTAPNQQDFHLHAFNPDTQKITVDLVQLLAGSNLKQDHGGPAGCMSGATDPECAPIFTAFAGAMHGSTIFRAIAK